MGFTKTFQSFSTLFLYLPWILPIIECKVVGYFVLVLFGKNFNITSCCWAFFLKKNSWKLICKCFFFIFFFQLSFAKKMFLLKIWCENDDIFNDVVFQSLSSQNGGCQSIKIGIRISGKIMGVGVMHYNSKWGDFFEGNSKEKNIIQSGIY